MALIANAFVRFQAQDSGLFRSMMRVERGFGTMKASYMQFAAATAGIALFGKVINDAIKFEAELFNVRKTAGLTRDEMDALGTSLKGMSAKTGIAKKQLAEIATVAGQLGIGTGGGSKGIKEIEQFTSVIARSRSAMPDYAESAEDAATKTAKLLNLMNLGVDEAENMLSSFNALSNTTAATSGDIAELTRRIGGTATIMGSSAADVAAFAATMTEIGVTSEVGGTAITKFIVDIQKDIGGFAAALGTAGDAFKRKFIEDPLAGLQLLLKELNKMDKVARFEFFKEMGVNGARLLDTLNKLSGDKGVARLAENMKTSNKAFEEGTSLQKEFEIRLESTQSATEVLAAAFSYISDTFAREFFPLIKEVSKSLAKTLTSRDFIEGAKSLGKSIAAVGQALAGALKFVLEFREAFLALGAVFAARKLFGLIFFTEVSRQIDGVTQKSVALRGVWTSLIGVGRQMSAAFKANAVLSPIGALGAAGNGVMARNALGQFTGFAPAFGKAAGSAGTLFKVLSGGRGVLAALGAGFNGIIALLGGPWVVGIMAAIGVIALLVRHFRKVREEMDNMQNFREKFGDMFEGIGAGERLLDTVDKLNEAAKKLNEAKANLSSSEFNQVGEGSLLVGNAPKSAPGARGAFDEAYTKHKENLERLKQDVNDFGKIIGHTGELYSDMFDEAGERAKMAAEDQEKLNSKIAAWQKKVTDFTTIFENIKESAPGLGFTEMFEEATKEFKKFGEVSEDQLKEINGTLLASAAKSNEFGLVYGEGIRKGLDAADIEKTIEEHGAQITNLQKVSWLNNATAAQDGGAMATAFYAMGLVSAQQLNEVEGGIGSITATAAEAMAKSGIGEIMAEAGYAHGSAYTGAIYSAIFQGVAALQTALSESLNMSIDPSNPQFASLFKMAEGLEQIKNGMKSGMDTSSSGGGGSKKESEAEKQQKKNFDELKKKLEDYQKTYVDSIEKRLEKKKEEVGLTEKEERLLDRVKRAQGDAFGEWKLEDRAEGIEKINEKIADLTENLEDMRETIKEVAETFDDMRVEAEDDLASINDDIASNNEEAANKVAKSYIDAQNILKETPPEGGWSAEDMKKREEAQKTVNNVTSKYLDMVQNANMAPDRSAEKQQLEGQQKHLKAQIASYGELDTLTEKQKNQVRIWNQELQGVENTLKIIADSAAKVQSITQDGFSGQVAKSIKEQEAYDKMTPDEQAVFDRDKENEGLMLRKQQEEAFIKDLDNQKRIQAELEVAQRKGDEEEVNAKREELSKVFTEGELARFKEANAAKLTETENRAISEKIAEADKNMQLYLSTSYWQDQITKSIVQSIKNRDAASEAYKNAEIQRMGEITKAVDEAAAAYSRLASAMSSGGSSSGDSGGGGMKGGYANDFMRGFARGGMTANVGITKPAGIVHGGEWVAPNWMVKRFPGLISSLESMRVGKKVNGYFDGGLVDRMRVAPQVQKSNEVKVEMKNTINTPLDLRAVGEQLGYALNSRLQS